MLYFFKWWKVHLSAALIAVFVAGPTAYLVIDREPPFHLSGFETLPKEIVAGSIYRISLTITRLNEKDCSGRVTLQVVDSTFPGRVWVDEIRPSVLSAQEFSKGPVPVVGRGRIMPALIPPGPVRIRTAMTFRCNFTHWLWPIKVEYPELLSTVLPPRT